MIQVATIYGPDVMTMQEAADALGYVYNTFATEYKGWGIPSERIAGRTMFYKADIEKWAAGRRPQKYGMTTRWLWPKKDAAA